MAESLPPTQPWWHEETLRRSAFASGYHEADISRLSGCYRSVTARLDNAYASPDVVVTRLSELMKAWRNELNSHIEASKDPRVDMVKAILEWNSPEETDIEESTVIELLSRWDSRL